MENDTVTKRKRPSKNGVVVPLRVNVGHLLIVVLDGDVIVMTDEKSWQLRRRPQHQN